MKHYILTIEKYSLKFDMNRCISIYRIIDNEPIHLGLSHHNSKTWKSPESEATQIIFWHEKGHSWIKRDYLLKDVEIHLV